MIEGIKVVIRPCRVAEVFRVGGQTFRTPLGWFARAWNSGSKLKGSLIGILYKMINAVSGADHFRL